MRRPSPWAVLSAGAAILAVIGAVSEFRNPPGGDPASLLYAAGRLLDGTRLYSGLVDLNPPFTFLFHMPFVLAARLLGLPVILVFRLGVLALIVLGGGTLWVVLRRPGVPAGVVHALWAGYLLGALGLVVGFFGEREHIQFVLVFPYLVLAMLRGRRDAPRRSLMAWTGMLAGVGIALKVTAGLVPVLVGVVVWLWRREWSEESAWALLTLGLCTLGGLVWAPGYLAEVRSLSGLYHQFALQPVSRLFRSGTMVWTIWAALAVLLLGVRTLRHRAEVVVWAAAVLGFMVSVAVQGKGFTYHYYAAVGAAITLMLLVLAADGRGLSRADALRRAMAGVGLVVAMAVPLVIVGARWSAPVRSVDDFSHDAYALIADLAPGTTLAVESSRLGDAFPAAVLLDLKLEGRFPHLWFLFPYDSTAVFLGRGTRRYVDSLLSPVERSLRHDVAADLDSARPAYMLVRAPDRDRTVLRYLCGDRLFRRAAGSYRLARANGTMFLFQRDTSRTPEGACASL